MSVTNPRSIYWLVSPCEICGRRVRASHLLRYWAARPGPTVADAEIMLVSSSGNRGLTNQRTPLWETLDARGAESVRPATGRLVGEFFEKLEARHLAAARAARDGAYRARYGRR